VFLYVKMAAFVSGTTCVSVLQNILVHAARHVSWFEMCYWCQPASNSYNSQQCSCSSSLKSIWFRSSFKCYLHPNGEFEKRIFQLLVFLAPLCHLWQRSFSNADLSVVRLSSRLYVRLSSTFRFSVNISKTV
jgi:hypothetical protein